METAKERIDILIDNALYYSKIDDELSDDQARLAKKIAMRVRTRLPYSIKQLFCKQCKEFIIPGKSSRIRLGRSNTRCIRISCYRCGHIYRKLLSHQSHLPSHSLFVRVEK
ncbi:MAG: RNase P subunit [Nitrososphaeraceae archaeon]